MLVEQWPGGLVPFRVFRLIRPQKEQADFDAVPRYL
jgi:hypothetical protein